MRTNEGLAEILESFLLSFAHPASVDHDVISVLKAIDPNLPKCESLELHGGTLIKDAAGRRLARHHCITERRGLSCRRGRRFDFDRD